MPLLNQQRRVPRHLFSQIYFVKTAANVKSCFTALESQHLLINSAICRLRKKIWKTLHDTRACSILPCVKVGKFKHAFNRVKKSKPYYYHSKIFILRKKIHRIFAACWTSNCHSLDRIFKLPQSLKFYSATTARNFRALLTMLDKPKPYSYYCGVCILRKKSGEYLQPFEAAIDTLTNKPIFVWHEH